MTVPRHAEPRREMNRLAMRCLFPLLVLNVTVSNQSWQVGPVFVSQILLFWPAIVCASIVVVASLGRRSIWPPILIGAVIITRALGANRAGGLFGYFYLVPLNVLFVLSGAMVALEMRGRLFRQIRLYFVLSVPLMFLQVAGAGSWTLALNTETTAVGAQRIETARISYPTLFVQPEPGQQFTIGQTRPAGFMHANNVLSLAIMFAVAVQFARIRSRRVTWVDVMLCAAVVLAMAKIVILGFALMAAWRIVTGSAVVRARIRRVLVVIALCYWGYALLFPSLFDYHLSAYRIGHSVFVRANDFVSRLDPNGALAQFLAPYLQDTPTLEQDQGVVSAFALFAGKRQFLYLVPMVVVVLGIPLRRSFRKMRRWSRERVDLAGLVLFVAVLFPVAVPIWGSPLYSFILGVGVMPAVWYYSRQREKMTFEPLGVVGPEYPSS